MWYYAQKGNQKGPVPSDELEKLIRAGEVGPGDLVWKEGLGDWTPAGKTVEWSGKFQHAGGGAEVPRADSFSTPPPMPDRLTYGTPEQGGGGYRRNPFDDGYSRTPPAPSGPQVPNYLWQSIAVTLLCCMPLGVVAIIYAAQVDQRVLHGDLEGARTASGKARFWCILAVVGFFIQLLALGALLVFAASEPTMVPG